MAPHAGMNLVSGLLGIPLAEVSAGELRTCSLVSLFECWSSQEGCIALLSQFVDRSSPGTNFFRFFFDLD